MSLTLVNADTDSITVCKPDGSPFSEQEQAKLLAELNSLFPNSIKWEDDGYYKRVLVVKAKNYVTQTQTGKVKIKGSALKASTKSAAMKDMIKEIIQSLLDNQTNQLEIYLKYVTEAGKVKDINRWAVRKTISDKTLNSARTNESKIRDAIEGTEIVEGDRCWLYYTPEDTLKLVEQFNGVYNIDRLVKSCYDTIKTFKNIVDIKQFTNYSLKKNKEKLQDLL